MSTTVYKTSGASGEASKSSKRPRNADATRQAILASALREFCRAGYTGVGVREIARGAGVTAILVNRYFGSKEGLFIAAVEAAFAEPSFVTGDLSALAESGARELLAKTSRSTAIDPFMLLLRSAGDPTAGAILRRAIERSFEAPLARALTGPDARVRASLMLALIAGLQLMRSAIGVESLRSSHERSLQRRFAGLLETLVRGE